MAPALPVYSRDEIKEMYPNLFPDRVETDEDGHFKLDNENCRLYSLIQNQCTFDGNQCVCVPFKRLFARCLDKNYDGQREVIGYKLRPVHNSQLLRSGISRRKPDEAVYRDVEITNWKDNDYEGYLTGEKKAEGKLDSDLLRSFMKTDKVFQQKVHEYYASLEKKK